MTPYARCSTRQSRQREAENRAWLTARVDDDGTVHLRKDPRRIGMDAHVHMTGMLHFSEASPQAFMDVLQKLLAPLVKRKRKGS